MFYPSKLEFQKLIGNLKPCWKIQDIQKKDTHQYVLELFEKLKQDQSILLFSGKRGRYSIMGIKPFLTFEYKNGENYLNKKKTKGHPIEILRGLFEKYKTPRVKDLPPFYAGAIGTFGYETFSLFEDIPKAELNDLKIPEIYLMFFDEVIVVDHLKGKLYLIGSGLSYDEAKEKVEEMDSRLHENETKEIDKGKIKKNMVQDSGQAGKTIASNFSREDYYKSIVKVKEYLELGDTFQVNISQRLEKKQTKSSYEVFKTLSQINPSPFAAYMESPDFQIVSCSPERLVRLKDKELFTQPIAGTRKRGKTQKEDEMFARELKNSEKEMAEHTMLVDLLRNDLGRVSEFGTVVTKNFAHIEKYSHVQHLVSNVYGILKKKFDIFDVLRAVFPGGTITGAPKIRTMEIISELEPTQRGPYTGSLGYIGFDGNADLNILIRTIVCVHKKMYIQVGGGIVIDGVEEREYKETWHKAAAMLEAVS